jgi:hypothetical protein
MVLVSVSGDSEALLTVILGNVNPIASLLIVNFTGMDVLFVGLFAVLLITTEGLLIS